MAMNNHSTHRILRIFVFFVTITIAAHYALQQRWRTTNDTLIDNLLVPPADDNTRTSTSTSTRTSTHSIQDTRSQQQVKNVKETPLERPQQKWAFEGLDGIVLPLATNETLPLITIDDYPPSACEALQTETSATTTTTTTTTADGKNSGIEGVNGHEALLKIRRGMLHSQQMVRDARTPSTNTNNDSTTDDEDEPKVLCMVYTASHRHDNLRAISNTWGRQCHGFIGISNETDASIGAIAIPHHGPEDYNNMWQKLRFAYKYVHDLLLHHHQDYDYFFVCGDDTYVVMDNFKSFLQSPEVHQLENGHLDVYSKKSQAAHSIAQIRPRPLLFGRPKWDSGRARVYYMKKDEPGAGWPIVDDPDGCPWNMTGYDHFTSRQFLGQSTFPIGGPGYVLNRPALDLWVTKGIPTWRPNATDAREDFFLGMFLEFYGIQTSDTRDLKGLERFRTNTAEAICHKNAIVHATNIGKLKDNFGVQYFQNGLDSVSNLTISFHLKYPTENGYYPRVDTTSRDLIYRYHAVLHNLCPNVQEGL
jgi:hypothetical protein